MDNVSGTIFQVQRWSIQDGDGIRSTVFLKGCPLRCQWCANPESWTGKPEVLFFRERCTGCGRCATVCDTGVARPPDDIASAFSRDSCRGCGACCAVCASGARKLIGSTVTVADVLKVISRDSVFYRESGGGVTFSGGEPFAQPEFLRQLVAACGRLGIDTAVETSGYFDWEQVKDIIEQLDCVFIDIKHMDDAVHQRLTGVSNRRILENIARIARLKPRTIVRVPLIAGVNADERNIRKMCEFLIRQALINGVELLPYHDYGQAKWTAVGVAAQVFTAPDAAAIDAAKKTIADYGLHIVDFS